MARTCIKRPVGLALTLLLISAFFRFYQLDSVPPGISGDTAYNGLDIQQVLAGHLALFFPANHGREALFIYFQAFLVAFAGYQPIVFSFASVAMGMLTVALACRLFAAIFGWRTGLIAAGLLSVSFWALNMSRFAQDRVSSATPFLLAMLYCLWRLLHTGRRRYAVLGGAALGLSLYTYLPARLFPLLVVLLCVVEWRRASKQLRALALFVAVSIVVFAPEGLYFASHWNDFIQRAQEVSVFNPNPQIYGAPSTPARSIGRTALMFFARGDENPQHNLNGLPVFDPWLAVLFAAGILLAVYRLRAERRYAWPLIWLPLACLPSALSHTAPDLDQAVAAAPAAYLFPAIALAAIPWRAAEVALATVAIILSGAQTFDRYFRQWAPDPTNQGIYGVGEARLAAAVKAQPETKAYVAFPFDDTLPAFRLAAQPALDLSWLPAETAAIPLPQRPRDALYAAAPTAVLRDFGPTVVPGFVPAGTVTDASGAVAFSLFRLSAEAQTRFVAAQKPLGQQMAGDFRLVSWEAVSPPGRLVVNLIWQQLKPNGPYDLNIHLLAPNGRTVVQSDRTVWPIEKLPGSASHDLGAILSADDLMVTQHSFDAPPGAYTLEIGAVHLGIKNPWTAGGPASGPVGELAHIPVMVNG